MPQVAHESVAALDRQVGRCKNALSNALGHMVTGSTLTEQLANLGVHLPAWPEEPEGSNAAFDWIQRGQVYAEGVRLWRAKLRNAPESTKGVVDQLLQHLNNGDQLNYWDRWLSSALHHEVKRVLSLDRWEQCVAGLRDSHLSDAQVLGAALALAEAQQLAGATTGVMRLIKEKTVSFEEAYELCALLTSRSDATWRFQESLVCHQAYLDSVALYGELSRLLRIALGESNEGLGELRPSIKESMVSSLGCLLNVLGDEDKWIDIPKARTIQLLNQKDLENALSHLEESLPVAIPKIARKGYARMLASQLLIDMGRWDDAQNLHQIALSQLKEYSEIEELRTSGLDILRTETELLTQELSLALSNGSLEATAPLSGEDGQRWQSLSRSQLGQDVWVLEQLGWKHGGFFVEFGATDGVLLSNSWLLEKYFDWNGICAEPNPKLFQQLQQNRSCMLSSACVYRSSGKQMRFVLANAYGGLEDLGRDDLHVDKRNAYAEAGNVIDVTTTSLLDLLDQQGAPAVIDYLSIDTEGSELAILEGFDWNRYDFRCITVEHNFTEQRQGIRRLLEAHGYECREAKWDDWYYKRI
jgi:FkbM family methyltransferase